MTVAELVALLSELPQDLPVVVSWDGRWMHSDEPGCYLADRGDLYPGDKSGPIVLIEP